MPCRIYQHLIKLGLPNFIEIVDYAKCRDAPNIFSPDGSTKVIAQIFVI